MVMNAKLESHSQVGVSAPGMQRPSGSAPAPIHRAASGTGMPAARRMRRIITREQGRALETIGHAVDYLNDCYLYDGAEEEILNVAGPFTAALQVLIAAHQEILLSLPVAEPWTLRVWNALFRRKPHLASAPW